MDKATFWGMVLALWVAVAGVRMLKELYIYATRKKPVDGAAIAPHEKSYTKFGLWWSAGLLLIVLASQI